MIDPRDMPDVRPTATEPAPGPAAPTVSIIIPALNERRSLPDTLEAIDRTAGRAAQCVEVIIVDGGSDDGTPGIARAHGASVISAPRGRGAQLRAGADAASGDVLWFLHADTAPPPDALAHIECALRDPCVAAGHFRVRFDGDRRAATLLSWLYPRLRPLGVCYGDSGVFIRRGPYDAIGGFRPYPIFEDADLVSRVRRVGRFVRVDAEVTTSSRRFEGRSFTLTFAHWSMLQALYWLGVSPRVLGRMYPSQDQLESSEPDGATAGAPAAARGGAA